MRHAGGACKTVMRAVHANHIRGGAASAAFLQYLVSEFRTPFSLRVEPPSALISQRAGSCCASCGRCMGDIRNRLFFFAVLAVS